MAFLIVPVMMLAQAAAPGLYKMARADVQACGAMAVERNERRAELASREAGVTKDSADLTARQAEVQAAAATVDKKNKKAIEQYNQQIDAANEMRSALQLKIAARDQYLAESNALTTSFNTKCSHRDFNPADLANLPAAQRAALGVNATTRTVKVKVPAKTRRRR